MENGQVSNNSITRNAATESMIDESDSTLPESESHQRLALDYSSKMENRTRRKRYLQRIKAQKSFFLALLFLTSIVVAPQLMQLNDESQFTPTARGPEWGCMDDGTYFWETNETTSIGSYRSAELRGKNASFQGNLHAPYPDIFYNTTDGYFLWKISTPTDSPGGSRLTLSEFSQYNWPDSTQIYMTNDRSNEWEYPLYHYSEIKEMREYLNGEYEVTHIIFSNLTNHFGELRDADFQGYKEIVKAYCDGFIRAYHLFWNWSFFYIGAPRPVVPG